MARHALTKADKELTYYLVLPLEGTTKTVQYTLRAEPQAKPYKLGEEIPFKVVRRRVRERSY